MKNDDDQYFLGSTVLVKSPENKNRYEVIDGQQRLTTLTILLSVLRDLTTDQEKRFDRTSYVYQRSAISTIASQTRSRILRGENPKA
jgi:uncharacterized protein with ParB-like and HNH nuclease domain